MKLKDLVNVTNNKRTKQTSLNIKKRELKKKNVDLKDVLKIDIPISKKIKEFEEM